MCPALSTLVAQITASLRAASCLGAGGGGGAALPVMSVVVHVAAMAMTVLRDLPRFQLGVLSGLIISKSNPLWSVLI